MYYYKENSSGTCRWGWRKRPLLMTEKAGSNYVLQVLWYTVAMPPCNTVAIYIELPEREELQRSAGALHPYKCTVAMRPPPPSPRYLFCGGIRVAAMYCTVCTVLYCWRTLHQDGWWIRPVLSFFVFAQGRGDMGTHVLCTSYGHFIFAKSICSDWPGGPVLSPISSVCHH